MQVQYLLTEGDLTLNEVMMLHVITTQDLTILDGYAVSR